MVWLQREEWMDDVMVDNGWDLMNLETTCCGKIAEKLNSSSIAECLRDGHAFKFKWQKLLAKNKKVGNHNKGIGIKEKECSVLSKQEQKDLYLSLKFNEDVFDAMHEWLKHKPTINHPHHSDLLHPNDGNYSQEIEDSNDIEEREDADPQSNANRNFSHDNLIINITSNLITLDGDTSGLDNF